MNRIRLPIPVRLWLIVMVSFGYFFQADNPNITPRIGLAISIADRHELSLGPFATDRIDEAFVNGSHFSDKAPGLSLLATPIAAAILAVAPKEQAGGVWFISSGTFSLYYFAVVYFSTVIVVSGLSALALVAVYLWSIRQGASRAAALVAALGLGLCSPVWGWSTVFVGHAPAGALLFIGFVLLMAASETATREPGARPAWTAGLAGLALGLAFTVEFTAGPAVAIIGIACFGAAMRGPAPLTAFRRAFLPSALGLIAAIIPLLIYNYLAFNSPFKLGYEGVSQNYPGMTVGFFGLSLPRPAIALALLIGPARGLLTFWPAFVLTPISFAASLMTPGFRLLAVVAGTIFAYYLFMNSGYYYWDGGASTGPRHLIAALPLMAPLLAVLWDRLPRGARFMVVTILVISLLVTMAYVSTEMFAPEQIVSSNPWRDFFLQRLLGGEMRRSLLAHFTTMSGYAALVPLLFLWVAGGWWLWNGFKSYGDVTT